MSCSDHLSSQPFHCHSQELLNADPVQTAFAYSVTPVKTIAHVSTLLQVLPGNHSYYIQLYIPCASVLSNTDKHVVIFKIRNITGAYLFSGTLVSLLGMLHAEGQRVSVSVSESCCSLDVAPTQHMERPATHSKAALATHHNTKPVDSFFHSLWSHKAVKPDQAMKTQLIIEQWPTIQKRQSKLT